MQRTVSGAADPYAQLSRKVAQQAAVAELGRSALTGTPLPALFDQAVRAVHESLGTELVSILQLDETQQMLTCRTNVGWSPDMITPVPLSASSQVGRTFLAGDAVTIPDLAVEETFVGTRHLLEHGIRSAATVAISADDRPVGVLAAHSRRPREFTDDDTLFLHGIANVLAAAVARDAADSARRASEERLSLLAEASRALTGSLDVGETLAAFARQLVPRLADRCVVHLEEAGRLVPVAAVPAEAAGSAALPTDVVQTGRPELRADEIRVPLTARGAVLGVVSLVSTTAARRYGEPDLALARELAHRAGAAVENARLHDLEQRARRRAERLQRVTSLLADALTSQQVVDVVLGEGIDASGARAGLVALVDEGGETISIAAARGYPDGTLEGWHTFPVGDELPVSVVVRTGEAAFCRTVEERNERFPPMAVLRDSAHAFAALPLQGRAAPFGGLALTFDGDREFPHEEQAFLCALASQCAQALERARLHEEQEARANAAFVLAHVVDGVLQLDEAGRIRFWNQAAERITGVAARDALGAPIASVLEGWDEAAASIVTSAAPGEATVREALPFGIGGRELWLAVAGIRLGHGGVYAFRDLSGERALEQARRDFLATASHELRTPLAAVYGAAETLSSRGDALDPGTVEVLLETIVHEGKRLARIIDDMLLANRLDVGAVEISMSRCDGAALAREIVALAAPRSRGIVALRLETEQGVPPIVCDADRLRQVLINLVDNAIKYSPQGGDVRLSLTHVVGRVRFSVHDQGLGIPAAELDRVFEKFYRLDPSLTNGVGGTGLGLYISRELVTRMGGTIGVESAPGRGSTFTVELPSA
jgi:two-component system phosphate regulon sensor histidine kinase PhoR